MKYSKSFVCICKHPDTHAYGGAAQLEVGYLMVSASWPSALNCNRVTVLPSRCESAVEAVFGTPHSCLTTPCPTRCSPAHANLCPIRMHWLILGSIHSENMLVVIIYYHTVYFFYSDKLIIFLLLIINNLLLLV